MRVDRKPTTVARRPRNNIVTFFRFTALTLQKLFQSMAFKAKTIMKKIFLFAVALAICSASLASAAQIRVRVSNFTFQPATINAHVGDVIVWRFVNGVHTTTSTSVPAGAQTWDAPIDSTHTQFRYRVQVAGTYQYQCNFHFAHGMVGTIVVSAASPDQVPATN
jgi:plastocyanin